MIVAEYTEPFLTERLDLALAKARRLVQNNIESLDDLNMALRAAISNYYGFPLFDKYFEDKTIDQLAFEAFYIKEKNTTGSQTAAQEAAANPDEAIRAIEDDFAAFEMPEPSPEEKKKMVEFMQSGRFPAEQGDKK